VARVPEGFALVEQPLPQGFELVGGGDDGDRRIDGDAVDNGGAGVGEDLAQEVEAAFQKIPGAPTLSEFAAGVNRSVLGALDFIGPDNINAILNLAGSEKRVPTFTQALGAEKGAFLEPGVQREIAATAGEFLPLAAGVGALFRKGAQQLPALISGEEGTAAGLLRQAGQVTAAQDITAAGLAGAGQAIGEEVGGEPGALIGSIVAPLTTIPLALAKTSATNLLKESAPSIDQLKGSARAIYNSLDDSGFKVPSQSFDAVANDITTTLRKEGFDVDLHPKIKGVIRRLGEEVGTEKTLTEMDTLRKVIRGASSSLEADERRLGAIAIDKIDNFMDDLGGQLPEGQQVGEAFKSARDLWGRARRAETIEDAIKEASSQASGFENGLRVQFRAIAKKIRRGKLKGFSKEEAQAIDKVVQGTNVGNVARALGKFGILDGLTSRSLTTLSGSGLAGFFGGGGAAAAVPIVGQFSGALAQRMTANNAKMASAITRAGKNGAQIARAYSASTPKAERDPTELAQLFIANEVPVQSISLKTVPRLVSDAAIIAAIAKMNDEKQKTNQNGE